MEVSLRHGFSCLIDEEDADMIGMYKWKAVPNRPIGKFYVAAHVKRTTIYLHRLILSAPKGVYVDHINADGLDNRRSNIRLCSPTLNNANRRRGCNISGFYGVHPHSGKWRAVIKYKGIVTRSRQTDTPDEAAREYDALAKRLFGSFATLNFPELA